VAALAGRVKVVHLLGWYFPDSVGGTEVYVQGLCRRQQAAGHEVLVAAPDSRHVAAERYEHEQVPVFRYAIPAEPNRDETNHRLPVRGAGRFYRWLADQRPDILHVHSFTTGVGLQEIREARRLGIRVIVTCHLPGLGYMCRTGELMQWGRSPCDGIAIPDKCAACYLTRLGTPPVAARMAGAIPPALSAGLGLIPGRLGTALGMTASVREFQDLQRQVFDLVETFVVLNDTARRMLMSNGSPAEKIVLNRLGLGHAHLTRKPAPGAQPTMAPVRIGYVGRLYPAKGVLELVRAAVAIPRAVAFHLDIRGPQTDEGSRRYADALRAAIGDDARVTIGPGVPGSDVPALLAEYDVLACPSIGFENGPTIALEAMAVGTPIIASRVGNFVEIVEDGMNGRLVTPGRIDEWSRALTEVALDPATIDRWRRALRPQRTMDEVAADYLSLYAAQTTTTVGSGDR
jgi:glycosyltransferase involved in cell wall biosynthesis